MAVYKRGKTWWYKFTWKGELIRESTKQTNKRVAEQMEATHKTSLAKGEVGLRDRKLAPTLADFVEKDFLPFVRSTSAGKPHKVSFTKTRAKNIIGLRAEGLGFDRIAARLNEEHVPTRTGRPWHGVVINRNLTGKRG
jgi:hypothetical protein